MNAWIGRALIAAGTAGMVYGIHLIAGTEWAVLLGGFILYVAGYHLVVNKARQQAMGAMKERARLTTPITEAHRRMN